VPGYLLDTNHLSPLITFNHPLRARIMRRIANGDRFNIPVVVLTEFLFGIQLVPRAVTNMDEWRQLQDSFGYYSIDKEDAEDAAELQVSLRRKGRQLATIDALIAIMANRHNLILLTTDQDFEFVPLLQHENWIR
jgi:tRNA(fMet)-specific endonuclease VapC